MDASVVELHNVFDDGKSKAGTAGGFGAAFVNSVEALENPVEVFTWDADAVVLYNELLASTSLKYFHRNMSTRVVVADGVFHKIVD